MDMVRWKSLICCEMTATRTGGMSIRQPVTLTLAPKVGSLSPHIVLSWAGVMPWLTQL